jgi:4-amino-4-deoxy-L-arabinose transferase-like glycosyltransferase
VAAGLLALLGLGLRVPGMLQSLWLDEVFRTRVGLSGDMFWSLLLYDVHNPLYNACMWVWIRVMGDSETAIRTPSLLAATALIAVAVWWTRARFGPLAAWVVGAWLAASPVAVWFSTEAKNNIFTVLLATIGVCALDSAMRIRRGWTTALAATANLLAVATDYQAMLVLMPAWVAFAVFACRRDPGDGIETHHRVWERLVPLVVCVGVAMLFIVPWSVFKLGHASELPRPYVGYLHWHEVLRLLIVWLPTGNAFPPLLGAHWIWNGAVIGVVVLPLLVAGIGRLGRSRAGVLVLVGLFGPPLLLMMANEVLIGLGAKTRLYQPRNLLVMLPWFAIALGAGASACWARWGISTIEQGRGFVPTAQKVLAWVVIGAPLVLGLASTGLIRTTQVERSTVATPNPDWRGLMAWARSSSSAGDNASLPVMISNTALVPLDYYAPESRGIEVYTADGRVERMQSAAREAAGPGGAFFLVHNPHWHPTMTHEEIQAVLSVGEVVEHARFRSLEAWRVRFHDRRD